MYRLEYEVHGVRATFRNSDVKVLRAIISKLPKLCKWELYNEGGILLDSNQEVK
jgi:hypothetical protein